MGWIQKTLNKLNPSQQMIADTRPVEQSQEPTHYYTYAYEKIEIVNRAVNMIVDDISSIPTWVGDQIKGTIPVVKGMRKQKLNNLLNYEPNLFQDINSFRRNLYLDYIMDGNIFIYWDGAHLYHLPASKMKIIPSKLTFVDHYMFDSETRYEVTEIIHIKENSFDSIYRGTSRLRPATETISLLLSMKKFQKTFFKNGTVTGLVVKTPDTLSQKVKDRLTASWQQKYNPESGGRTPMILDGGMEIDRISNTSFKDLDFESSINTNEATILKALGVPPILLDSGNNANLRPNMRLYYLQTVIPILKKVNFALERFFGYIIEEDLTKVSSMQPEMSDLASYFTSLTNGGIITANESRRELGFPDMGTEHDELRIPANIAGSAANPSEGGRPNETSKE